MPDPKIAVACRHYDGTSALIRGLVGRPGFELNVVETHNVAGCSTAITRYRPPRLCTNLLMARKISGLTQKAMVRKLGIDPRALAKLEKGTRASKTISDKTQAFLFYGKLATR